MDIDRELADEEWRKNWREKNERALVPKHRRNLRSTKDHSHATRLEWEVMRKKVRDIFGDAYLDGVPLRCSYD